MLALWLRAIRWVASWLPCREIYAEDGKLYLERYRVFGWTEGSTWRGPSLYLHRFRLPDQDVAPHNHPWKWARSLILSGGYTEERSHASGMILIDDGKRRLSAGSLNRIGAGTFHRITEIHGETWTLFLVAPKSRSWVFWVSRRGPVPWRERLAERGIPL
jgi:hypothetical protein